eukprot:Selendium_serpulae@DN9630_c0_g1_i1.p1
MRQTASGQTLSRQTLSGQTLSGQTALSRCVVSEVAARPSTRRVGRPVGMAANALEAQGPQPFTQLLLNKAVVPESWSTAMWVGLWQQRNHYKLAPGESPHKPSTSTVPFKGRMGPKARKEVMNLGFLNFFVFMVRNNKCDEISQTILI